MLRRCSSESESGGGGREAGWGEGAEGFLALLQVDQWLAAAGVAATLDRNTASVPLT